MGFMNIFTHTSILVYFDVGEHIPHAPRITPQSGGELDPQRLKRKNERT
jgi:hypothetical protein